MFETCFAYEKECKCKVLDVDKCIAEGCTFFKTQEQIELSYKKVRERLARLEEKTQQFISHKYYSGKIKW